MRLSRRRFLTTLSGAASMALLAPQTSAAGTATGSPSVTFYDRYLIVNADDLGADDGINRGIIEAHERGIVTSASLMVNMPSAKAIMIPMGGLPPPTSPPPLSQCREAR